MENKSFNGLVQRITKILVFSLFFISFPAHSIVIELALLLDKSTSIGSDDFDLQTDAYKTIFNNNFYDSYVANGDELYVKVFSFSDNVKSEIDWTAIDSNTSAAAFGDLFSDIKYLPGLTSTTQALKMATQSLLDYQTVTSAERLIIDISTDGLPNVPKNIFNIPEDNPALAIAAAADAQRLGVTVNAIGVGTGIDESFLSELTTAGGGFYATAIDFNAFQSSLADKLYREINAVSVPEPSVLYLMLVGLIGFNFRGKWFKN